MSDNLLNLEKIKLKEHYERFLQCDSSIKFLHFRFLMDQINRIPGFKAIHKKNCDEGNLYHHFSIDQIMFGKDAHFISDDYKERITISAALAEKILLQNDEKFIIQIGFRYKKVPGMSTADYYRVYCELFLDAYISYLLHEIDKNLITLDLLANYKKRSEWFNRELLLQKGLGSAQAEHTLASDLYMFLFDKGMDFYLEPASPNGEIDFVASQRNSPYKLLVEVKVLGVNSHAQTLLRNGCTQILRYAKDYHESTVYLILFNLKESAIILHQEYMYDGIKINFTVINLGTQATSASKEKYQSPIVIDLATLLTTSSQ